MADAPYPEIARVDAVDKVRGVTRYGSDNNLPGMLHAIFAIATIPRGSITALDTSAARAAPGVRLVLTHLDTTSIKAAGYLLNKGAAFQSFQPMLSPRIAYRGQPIAMIVADTLENAERAADLVRATYAREPHNVNWTEAPASDMVVQADSPLPPPIAKDKVAGNADREFAGAPVKIDVTYTTAAQHHNAIEMIATVAEWRNGMLTVHEGTQNAQGVRGGVSRQLGINPEQVRVVSPWIGGGFGQKNSTQMQTAFTALAARRLNAPVKLVVPRLQIFHDASFRPASRHRIRMGGDRNGKIVAAIHEADHQTSRHDLWPGQYAETSSHLHGIENYRGRERMVRADTQTPGYMRGPWEGVAAYAFEAGIDELAYAMEVDPVALRLANDTQMDPIAKMPLSSRFMAECLRRGAAKFGWADRTARPGSMRAADGTQMGWGVACGAYGGSIAAAQARLRVTAAGEINISVAGHEMGQGIRTAIANVLSDRLGVPPQAITIDIGTTGPVPQHLTAGSWGTATAIPPVSDAAAKLLADLSRLAPDVRAGSLPSAYLRAAGRDSYEVEVRKKAPGQPDTVFADAAKGAVANAGPEFPEFTTYSYIAHFVEVRVEPTTRRIRVPRVVSVADCGRIISPRTAASQIRGGVVWGIGAALREESEVEERHGGFLNSNLADYLVPVNADIGSIDVEFIDQPDPRFNSVGLKSVGEVAMCGVAPAISNAVYHATGRRVRHVPIRLEDLA